MLNIHIVAIGKLKEIYWQEAEAEYLKRLRPWAKIKIQEIKEEPFGEKDNPEMVKRKEAEKITAVLDKINNAHIIVMDEHGASLSSIQFARQFGNLANQQITNIVFVIGGPLGLDASVLKFSNQKLSLSQMTFTHQMARIFLLEQIYRAQMISAGRKYHY